MAEEITNLEIPDGDSVDTPSTPPNENVVDLDQSIKVGGEEYSAKELADTMENYEQLKEYTEHLEGFREATGRLMNPETNAEVKKRDARQILLDMNYTPDQVDEWVQIYDQDEPMTNEPTPAPQVEDPRTGELNSQVLKMRAQMLQQNLENSLSSAMDGEGDGKVLMDWLSANRSEEDSTKAKNSVAERVRSQALENLRQRRNYAGSFEDSWVGEEVKKAADKVAADMLTVIGDTSKIGRVPETGGHTEALHRKPPVELPSNKGKTFGEVEGQLRNWTSDQLLRSLTDTGGETKL